MNRIRSIAVLLAALGCSAPAAGERPVCREDTEPAQRALASEVSIAPEALRGLGIEIGRARAGASVAAGTIPAQVAPDPTLVARIAPLVGGRLERVSVVVGARVEAGDVLGELASTAAAEMASATVQARARLQAAEAALERQRALRQTGVASARALIEAETEFARARAELAGLGRQRRLVGSAAGRVRLVTPIAGIVTEVRVGRGSALDAGELAFVVVDTSRVWVVGRAPERLAPSLRQGAPARVRLFAYGAERWPGTLAYVAPLLDPDAHTLEVRIELANADGRLRPGLLGAIELVALDEAVAVTVPADAVVSVRGHDVVFVPTGREGTFAVVPVALARRDADDAVIAHGLTPDAPLVVRGAFVLASELLRAELGDENHP